MPLDHLATVVCVRLHEVALMVVGSVSLVYLPAVQHIVASLFSHIWQVCGVIDDYVTICRDMVCNGSCFHKVCIIVQVKSRQQQASC